MNLDMTFEPSPWERELQGLEYGQPLSAARFLALMEGEDDEALEDAFDMLEQGHNALILDDLPKLAFSGEAARRLREEAELAGHMDLTGALDANDPLRLYLEEMAAMPACGDPELLALELLEGKEVHEQLLNGSLSRVVEFALEHTGWGVLLLDLIQEGSLGLWQGIVDYRGGEFGPWRDWWIRQAMACEIIAQARASGLGQRMRQAVEDYRMVDERLLSELGRNPTPEEVAEAMHMTVSEVETVRKFLDNARMVGKAHEQKEPEEENPEDNQAVEDTAYYQTRERVDSLMSGISELESRVVTMRYGLDGKAPLTAQEVGRKLDLTVSEVVELETAALTKMRQSGE